MRTLSKRVRTYHFNTHNMPTHNEITQSEFFFCKIIVISQIFRIFAKYSERYCSRSVARAIRYEQACLWDIFRTCFSILRKVLSSEFFYFPPLSITVVNLTSREMSRRRKRKMRRKRGKSDPPAHCKNKLGLVFCLL